MLQKSAGQQNRIHRDLNNHAGPSAHHGKILLTAGPRRGRPAGTNHGPTSNDSDVQDQIPKERYLSLAIKPPLFKIIQRCSRRPSSFRAPATHPAASAPRSFPAQASGGWVTPRQRTRDYHRNRDCGVSAVKSCAVQRSDGRCCAARRAWPQRPGIEMSCQQVYYVPTIRNSWGKCRR